MKFAAQSDKISGMPRKRSPYNIAVGKRLENLRLAKGYKTIREFANYIKVGEDTYRAWEKGDNLIPPPVVDALQQRFKIDHNWIYKGDPGGIPVKLAEELKLVA